MKAKEYLRQIRRYDKLIMQRRQQKEEYLERMESISGVSYDQTPVMTSPRDRMAEQMAKYGDILQEIDELEEKYREIKHQIIGEIHQLDKTEHIELLYKRYVEYKPLDTIAMEMDYSHDRIRHIHGDALKEFYEMILKDRGK